MIADAILKESLAERRERALASPLKAGAQLSPLDAVRHPTSVSSERARGARDRDRGTVALAPHTLPPYRLPHKELLAEARLISHDLTFNLVQQIIGGSDHLAQEWQAEACYRGRSLRRIVLKFLVDEFRSQALLFGEPDSEGTAECQEHKEMRAYTKLQHLQGRSVLHCYGAYRFRMPWGSDVTGIVLEDLEGQEPLSTFVQRRGSSLQTADCIDALARASFDLVHRVQAAGIAAHPYDPEDIRVMQESTIRQPHLVLTGLANSSLAEEYEEYHISVSDTEWGGPWQEMDEQKMFYTLRCEARQPMGEWWRKVVETEPTFLYWTEHNKKLDDAGVKL